MEAARALCVGLRTAAFPSSPCRATARQHPLPAPYRGSQGREQNVFTGRTPCCCTPAGCSSMPTSAISCLTEASKPPLRAVLHSKGRAAWASHSFSLHLAPLQPCWRAYRPEHRQGPGALPAQKGWQTERRTVKHKARADAHQSTTPVLQKGAELHLACSELVTESAVTPFSVFEPSFLAFQSRDSNVSGKVLTDVL